MEEYEEIILTHKKDKYEKGYKNRIDFFYCNSFNQAMM